MGWSDLVQILAIVAFWFLCDWASPTSRRRRGALHLAGIVLLIVGNHNGFLAGQEKAARDAQQAKILTSPEMPR